MSTSLELDRRFLPLLLDFFDERDDEDFLDLDLKAVSMDRRIVVSSESLEKERKEMKD
jgi:hypothetical protein